MSFRFRFVSSVSLSALCLLAADAALSVHAQEPPTSPVPPAQPAGQPAPTVRPRMREHYVRGAAIRDAVIRADLEAVREPATWLAEHAQDDLPASGQVSIQAMQLIAADLAKAPDLVTAAAGVSKLAASCGACHSAVNATPTLMAAIPKGEDDSLQGRMKKHSRGADLLYRGLIVPSDHSWTKGAEALSGDPMEIALKLRKGPQPQVEALAKQLYDQAQEAKRASASDRPALYGQMLVTCSSCHVQQKVRIKMPEPPG
jgi:cytochrome c553